LTDHTAFVYSVAFSPDGRTLVTGSADRSAILWDVSDPAHPQRLGLPVIAHTNQVVSVAFARTGRPLPPPVSTARRSSGVLPSRPARARSARS